MKKIIYIILDGAADHPIPELGNKTPLEAARTPALDFFARNGKNGAVRVLPFPAENDEATIALLGHDIFKVYTGRGPIEAVGGGVPFKNGNLAVRCNFATAKDDKLLTIKTPLPEKESKELEKSIQTHVSLSDADYLFKKTSDYRGVLVIDSKQKLSAKISGTYPGYHLEFIDIAWEREGEVKSVPISSSVEREEKVSRSVPLEKGNEPATSARLLNEFLDKSRMILENHPINISRIARGMKPANIILARDAGTKIPNLHNFKKTHWMNWAALAELPLEKGIAMLTNMEVIPGITNMGNFSQNMAIRALTLLKNIHFYDGFYVQINEFDGYSHTGDFNGKVNALEQMDQYFLKPLMDNLDLENTLVIIASSHVSSSVTRVHTDEPVPVVVTGGGIMPDGNSRFSEKEFLRGSLGKMNAMNLLPYVVKLARNGNQDI